MDSTCQPLVLIRRIKVSDTTFSSRQRDQRAPKVGGFVAGKYGAPQLVWLAQGSSVRVVSTDSGQRVAEWTFVNGSYITGGIGIYVDDTFPVILLGVTSGRQGLLACFDVSSSRLTQCIAVPFAVTCINLISCKGCLNESDDPFTLVHPCFRDWHTTVGVGTSRGNVFLYDLDLSKRHFPCFDIIPQQMNPVLFEEINSVPLPPDTCIDVTGAVMSSEEFMCWADSTSIQQINRGHAFVSSIQFFKAANLFAIGYSFGSYLLLSLADGSVLMASEFEEYSLPVTGFLFQEPENDPRKLLFLWICRGPNAVFDVELKDDIGVSLELVQLCFAQKQRTNSGFCYKDYESSVIRFAHDISGSTSLFCCSVIKDASCNRRNHQGSLDTTINDENQVSDTSLVTFCWREGPSTLKAATFDLNAWYHAQLPERLRFSGDYSSYMSFVEFPFDEELLLDFIVIPESVRRYSSVANFHDMHFYPSALSFRCVSLLSDSIVIGCVEGIQTAVVSAIEKAGTKALESPRQYLIRAQAVGLLPTGFWGDLVLMSMDEQRQLMLTVLLENGSINSLVSYVREFGKMNSGLCFLSAWMLIEGKRAKQQLDSFNDTLFESVSGSVMCRDLLLMEHLRGRLQNLLVISKKCIEIGRSLFLSASFVEDLEQQHATLRCVVEYATVLCWFVSHKLLPQGEASSIQYDATDIAHYTSQLRKDAATQNCVLLIDTLLDGVGMPLSAFFKETHAANGEYPPPSLSALVGCYLIESVPFDVKSFLTFYALLDMFALAKTELMMQKVHELCRQYDLTFWNVSNSSWLYDLTMAAWLYDHNDKQAGRVCLLQAYSKISGQSDKSSSEYGSSHLKMMLSSLMDEGFNIASSNSQLEPASQDFLEMRWLSSFRPQQETEMEIPEEVVNSFQQKSLRKIVPSLVELPLSSQEKDNIIDKMHSEKWSVCSADEMSALFCMSRSDFSGALQAKSKAAGKRTSSEWQNGLGGYHGAISDSIEVLSNFLDELLPEARRAKRQRLDDEQASVTSKGIQQHHSTKSDYPQPLVFDVLSTSNKSSTHPTAAAAKPFEAPVFLKSKRLSSPKSPLHQISTGGSTCPKRPSRWTGALSSVSSPPVPSDRYLCSTSFTASSSAISNLISALKAPATSGRLSKRRTRKTDELQGLLATPPAVKVPRPFQSGLLSTKTLPPQPILRPHYSLPLAAPSTSETATNSAVEKRLRFDLSLSSCLNDSSEPVMMDSFEPNDTSVITPSDTSIQGRRLNNSTLKPSPILESYSEEQDDSDMVPNAEDNEGPITPVQHDNINIDGDHMKEMQPPSTFLQTIDSNNAADELNTVSTSCLSIVTTTNVCDGNISSKTSSTTSSSSDLETISPSSLSTQSTSESSDQDESIIVASDVQQLTATVMDKHQDDNWFGVGAENGLHNSEVADFSPQQSPDVEDLSESISSCSKSVESDNDEELERTFHSIAAEGVAAAPAEIDTETEVALDFMRPSSSINHFDVQTPEEAPVTATTVPQIVESEPEPPQMESDLEEPEQQPVASLFPGGDNNSLLLRLDQNEGPELPLRLDLSYTDQSSTEDEGAETGNSQSELPGESTNENAAFGPSNVGDDLTHGKELEQRCFESTNADDKEATIMSEVEDRELPWTDVFLSSSSINDDGDETETEAIPEPRPSSAINCEQLDYDVASHEKDNLNYESEPYLVSSVGGEKRDTVTGTSIIDEIMDVPHCEQQLPVPDVESTSELEDEPAQKKSTFIRSGRSCRSRSLSGIQKVSTSALETDAIREDAPVQDKVVLEKPASLSDVYQLSDDQLRTELKSFGVNVAVISTTRSLLQKRLLKLRAEAAITTPELLECSSVDSEVPVINTVPQLSSSRQLRTRSPSVATPPRQTTRPLLSPAREPVSPSRRSARLSKAPLKQLSSSPDHGKRDDAATSSAMSAAKTSNSAEAAAVNTVTTSGNETLALLMSPSRRSSRLASKQASPASMNVVGPRRTRVSSTSSSCANDGSNSFSINVSKEQVLNGSERARTTCKNESIVTHAVCFKPFGNVEDFSYVFSPPRSLNESKDLTITGDSSPLSASDRVRLTHSSQSTEASYREDVPSFTFAMPRAMANVTTTSDEQGPMRTRRRSVSKQGHNAQSLNVKTTVAISEAETDISLNESIEILPALNESLSRPIKRTVKLPRQHAAAIEETPSQTSTIEKQKPKTKKSIRQIITRRIALERESKND